MKNKFNPKNICLVLSFIYILILLVIVSQDSCTLQYSMIPLVLIFLIILLSLFKPLWGGLSLTFFGVLMLILLMPNSVNQAIPIVISMPLILIGIALCLCAPKNALLKPKG